MFFILSKVLVYFLFPYTWVLLLLVWRYRARSARRKRNLLIAACAIFLFFSIPWFLNQFARLWDPPQAEIPAGKKYSCVIVLGGFVSEDRNKNGFFNNASDRYIEALKLYKQGYAEHILVSGGNSNFIDHSFGEGHWVYGQLLAMGVPESDMLIENASSNTLENAKLTRKILDSAHLPPPYLLVTSAFHMPRAAWVFNKAGMAVDIFPCNYIAGKGSFNFMDLLPQLYTMDTWNVYIKEVVGLQVYKLKGLK